MMRERVALEQRRIADVRTMLSDGEVAVRLDSTVTHQLSLLLEQQRMHYQALLAQQKPSWKSLSTRVQTGDRLLAECLAVVAGAFSRPIRTIDAACREAQAVTEELVGLTSISPDHTVIPAEAECVSLLSSVVRRRFPDHGVWDLPVIAHEFGHLVARDLIDVNPLTGSEARPLADLLSGHARQMAELAADVFGVLVYGPAYCMALVLHRMDPSTVAVVESQGATHPGDASRVEGVLHALRLLGLSDIPARRQQYDFVDTALRAWWAEAQADVESSSRLNEDDAARVRSQVGKIWDELTRSKVYSIRYRSFAAAGKLAAAGPDNEKSGRPAHRDVINAAWLVRFRSWRDGRPLPDWVEPWVKGELR